MRLTKRFIILPLGVILAILILLAINTDHYSYSSDVPKCTATAYRVPFLLEKITVNYEKESDLGSIQITITPFSKTTVQEERTQKTVAKLAFGEEYFHVTTFEKQNDTWILSKSSTVPRNTVSTDFYSPLNTKSEDKSEVMSFGTRIDVGFDLIELS